MKSHNRRKFDRLRIDRSVRIGVQLFPVMPFLGEAINVGLINLSPGGIALSLDDARHLNKLKKGSAVRIHIRLPGLPIEECRGVVARSYLTATSVHVVGVRFTKLAPVVLHELHQMSKDNSSCDARIASGDNAWCLPTCSFYSLCRKPLRFEDGNGPVVDPLEISFQSAD